MLTDLLFSILDFRFLNSSQPVSTVFCTLDLPVSIVHICIIMYSLLCLFPYGFQHTKINLKAPHHEFVHVSLRDQGIS